MAGLPLLLQRRRLAALVSTGRGSETRTNIPACTFPTTYKRGVIFQEGFDALTLLLQGDQSVVRVKHTSEIFDPSPVFNFSLGAS